MDGPARRGGGQPGPRRRRYRFLIVSSLAVEEDSNPQASNATRITRRRPFDRKDWARRREAFEARVALVLDPDNADIQNYLGFSYRKMGQLESFPLLSPRRAEPRHTGERTRSIGEAFRRVPQLRWRKKHLEELRKPARCREELAPEKAFGTRQAPHRHTLIFLKEAEPFPANLT